MKNKKKQKSSLKILEENFMGGKYYFIYVTSDNKKTNIERVTNGFNSYELLGLLEISRIELVKQIKDHITHQKEA